MANWSEILAQLASTLEGDKLGLILRSPGGSPEAPEAIVLCMRSRFSDVRVVVPQLAMSAATMIACAADEVVFGKHSFLGPTDPPRLAFWLVCDARARRPTPCRLRRRSLSGMLGSAEGVPSQSGVGQHSEPHKGIDRRPERLVY